MTPATEIRAARIVLWQAGKLLVQSDLRLAPEERFWRLPGGRIEPGESPRAAAVRESAEELHIPVDVGDLWIVGENAYRKKGRRVHEFVFYFGASAAPIAEGANVSGEDHLEAKLLTPGAIRQGRFLPSGAFASVFANGPAGPGEVLYIVEGA